MLNGSILQSLAGLYKLEVECSSEEDAKCVRLLPFLCGAWFLLWFLLPVLLLENTYIDIMEIVVWSRNLHFGYDRNPYFGAWLAHFAYNLSGGSIWVFYLLGQVSVLVSLLCVWKLARSFLTPSHAFVAVVLSMGVLFHGVKTLEFNDDVLEIGLWSLTILFFHKALLGGRLRDWLLVGLFSGLSFMTKYYGLALFASMGAVVVFSKEGRAALKDRGIYLCGLLFLAISLPNIIWLCENNFVSIFYSLDRANLSSPDGVPFMRHLTEPFDCLSRALPALLPALIAFALIFHRRSTSVGEPGRFDKLFVSVICWGPFSLTLLFSILTGGEIKYSWLTPDFLLMGLFLVMFWRPFVSAPRLALLLSFVVLLALVCGTVFGVQSLVSQPCKKKNCPYENFPGKVVADDLSKLWRDTYGTKLKYVVGSREEACNVAVFSSDRPEAFFNASRRSSPWIDADDFRKSGALIVWKGEPDKRPPWFGKLKRLGAERYIEFPARSYPRATKEWFTSLTGLQPKDVRISFVLLKPEADAP